jgi:hypothetical protein
LMIMFTTTLWFGGILALAAIAIFLAAIAVDGLQAPTDGGS